MTPVGAAAVAEARAWIGTPYIHQASSRGHGTDCLGLLLGVWRAVVGAEPAPIPAYTWDWAEPAGEEVLARAARTHLWPAAAIWAPGDVLLFRMRERGVAKHLGILAEVGPGPSFVHAYTGHGVVENALSAPWRRRVVARFRFPEERA
jgi:NlpC/P60 family putative phage cell wall peptidase